MTSSTKDSPMSISILDQLWFLHKNPEQQAPEALLNTPLSIEGGQNLQIQLLKRWLEQGEELGGWKIGLTSGASRNAMGKGIRPFGFILKSRIGLDSKKIELNELKRGGVENEVCFGFNSTLSAGTTVEEVKLKIGSIHPGFEINQKRLPNSANSGLRVADNLSNWGMIYGPDAGTEIKINEIFVTLYANGKSIEHTASQGHIDDHYKSICTLANKLGEYGLSIEKGHKVITGAFGKTPLAKGFFEGKFSHNIGSVSLEIL